MSRNCYTSTALILTTTLNATYNMLTVYIVYNVVMQTVRNVNTKYKIK